MKFTFPLFLGLLPFALSAQTPFPPLPPVFRDDVVPRVDILLPPDSLAVLLDPDNEHSEYEWHATFIFDNGEIKDTLENAGFKLRGNTSVSAQKKSFRVSLNTYEPGRKWHGLEKLNLNGEHNDPTVARAKTSWDLLRQMEVPAPRANHVELHVNGNFFGLYVSVEHVDEEFVESRFGNKEGNLYKCLWPADLAWKGSNPDLYKEEFGGRRAYALVTNEAADDYADLANFIAILNNAPLEDLPCELEQVFNVDGYLKACAFDILAGNWDGPVYNKNNFYLYHNPATGKFEYIPYDLDNTFGIDWFGVNWTTRSIYAWAPSAEPRPIYKRLLAVPEYKDRFTFYLGEFLENIYREDLLFPHLDSLEALISPSAEADPYRPLDYGFTFADFQDAFESGLPFFHTPFGLKEFASARRESALQQLQPGDISPVIRNLADNHPNAFQDILLSAEVEDDGSVASAKACWQLDGQSLICQEMFDDGQYLDGGAGDGAFGLVVEAAGQEGLLEWFATATDDAGQESRQPVCGFRSVFLGEAAAPLAINEVMASNQNTHADEAGEFDDWVEIFSMSDAPLFLGSFHLTDDPGLPGKWKMPDIWIQPQEYLVFWADNEEAQGERHANFKLSAGGEFIGIYENAGGSFALADGYAFGGQETDLATGRLPDGTGVFQPVAATPGAPNQPLATAASDAGLLGFNITVSPNPAAGALKIVLESETESLSGLEVLDARGAPVLRQSFAPCRMAEIPASSLAAGVYFLKVQTAEGKIAVRKVVVGRK